LLVFWKLNNYGTQIRVLAHLLVRSPFVGKKPIARWPLFGKTIKGPSLRIDLVDFESASKRLFMSFTCQVIIEYFLFPSHNNSFRDFVMLIIL
jgi:hypothetical protein